MIQAPPDTNTPTPLSKTIGDATDSANMHSVLGVQSIPSDIHVATPSPVLSTKPIIISLLLIASGFGLLSGVFAWKKYTELSHNMEQ